METKPTKCSTCFDALDNGDVFSPKRHTNELFMKIAPTVIKRHGDEIVNAVSLLNGELICAYANDEVLHYYNARIAL